ncbi:hypothetical protein F2P45_21275 [Massilia sp. CCM 8733]|uniref:DUF2059 domain-containing protein n=1 Tax=Massilia mucilaginosa TaxID=2609282 RepID=A0ABX0NXC2_9BURK|nr:hypothetical protein [Massilia mucilaginosa]NHZ91517.1 hypothetical protein [Massilia mucilaginosa]
MTKPATRTALLLAVLLPLMPMRIAGAATPATRANTSASASAPLAAAHLEAVRYMLSVVNGETILQAAVKENSALRPVQQELFRHLFSSSTPQRMQELIVRTLARHLSQEDARSISEAYATAPGQRALRTPADDVAAFNALPPALLLSSAVGAARADIQKTADEWGAEALAKITEKALSMMQIEVDSLYKRAAYTEPLLSKYWKSMAGVVPVDQLATAQAAGTARAVHAEWTFLQTVREMEWSKMLTPDNLASAGQVAACQRKLDVVEVGAGRYLHARRDNLRQTDDTLNQIDMPFESKALADAAQALVREAAELDSFEKGQAALIAAHRAILAFAAERPGKLSVKNDKLVFANKADQRTYAALRKKLGEARASDGFK